MIVSAGFIAPLDGKKLASTTTVTASRGKETLPEQE
jgi:hypothetical protein